MHFAFFFYDSMAESNQVITKYANIIVKLSKDKKKIVHTLNNKLGSLVSNNSIDWLSFSTI